jgi:hypothetical protein
MNMFWDVTMGIPVGIQRRLGRTYGLHLQGRRVRQTSIWQQDGGGYVPPKRRPTTWSHIPENITFWFKPIFKVGPVGFRVTDCEGEGRKSLASAHL